MIAAALAGLSLLALVLAVIAGWVLNIIAIIHMDLAFVTGTLVARGLGVVVFPLGAALGWFL